METGHSGGPPEMGEPGLIIELRSVAAAVADALRTGGMDQAAEVLERALAEDLSGPEETLVLRSALISARNHWESLAPASLAGRTRAVLGRAKADSIEAN